MEPWRHVVLFVCDSPVYIFRESFSLACSDLCCANCWPCYPCIFLLIQVVLCFGISVIYHRYIGFAVVSLLVEVNSIFLHWRQLLLLMNFPKSSPRFKTVITINIGTIILLQFRWPKCCKPWLSVTFIVFRMLVFLYMVYWLFANFGRIPLIMSTIAIAGMFVMVSMNAVLLFRLIRSDFFDAGERVMDCRSVSQSKHGFTVVALRGLELGNCTVLIFRKRARPADRTGNF